MFLHIPQGHRPILSITVRKIGQVPCLVHGSLKMWHPCCNIEARDPYNHKDIQNTERNITNLKDVAGLALYQKCKVYIIKNTDKWWRQYTVCTRHKSIAMKHWNVCYLLKVKCGHEIWMGWGYVLLEAMLKIGRSPKTELISQNWEKRAGLAAKVYIRISLPEPSDKPNVSHENHYAVLTKDFVSLRAGTFAIVPHSFLSLASEEGTWIQAKWQGAASYFRVDMWLLQVQKLR